MSVNFILGGLKVSILGQIETWGLTAAQFYQAPILRIRQALRAKHKDSVCPYEVNIECGMLGACEIAIDMALMAGGGQGKG